MYRGAGQVGLTIRDTKRYIVWFENRGVHVECDRMEFFIDFTGLGGRGTLEVIGNGGSVSDCVDTAIRTRRKPPFTERCDFQPTHDHNSSLLTVAIYSCTHALPHLFRSLTHSLTQSLTHSLSRTYSFTRLQYRPSDRLTADVPAQPRVAARERFACNGG